MDGECGRRDGIGWVYDHYSPEEIEEMFSKPPADISGFDVMRKIRSDSVLNYALARPYDCLIPPNWNDGKNVEDEIVPLFKVPDKF